MVMPALWSLPGEAQDPMSLKDAIHWRLTRTGRSEASVRTERRGTPPQQAGGFGDVKDPLGPTQVYNLRHTFASRYMMNGGDLYELAKNSS